MFEMELGLPFMVSDRVFKFQMICLWETKVIEWKSWVKLIIHGLIKMSAFDWSITHAYKTHAQCH